MVRHLYIHVPFCHRICPYCSFYKHTPGGTDHSAFVGALLSEIDHHLRRNDIQPFTIYLGGGTPSALARGHLEALLKGIADRLDLSQLEEWDLEANPATFGLEKAELMKSCGISRLSLGVQSWTQTTLDTLGRDHSPQQAETAYSTLREAGFNNINLDLMFSIPGQREADWRHDLERTIALQPDHISAYNLNYEEDTEFFERLQAGELDDDEERNARMFQLGEELLGAAGYRHYEISNYALPGHHSRHNAAYWAGEAYLGIGPGAFSTVGVERWRNLPDTAGYISAISQGAFRKLVTEHETIDAAAFRTERVALELRTERGVGEEHIEHNDKLDELEARGLIVRRGQRIALTESGRLLADPIAAELV